MKDYHLNVFWSDEDESYVADIPDLFPCAAFGDSLEEALAEVLVAKEVWLESARESGLPTCGGSIRPRLFRCPFCRPPGV